MKYLRMIKKILLYFIIAITVLIIGLIINSGNMKNKYDDYTSYNTKEEGVKALYLLAGEMGYNTDRFKRPVRFVPDGTTLVIIMPYWYTYMDDLEKKYLKDWVQRGNSLVFISDEDEVIDQLVSLLEADFSDEIDGYGDWDFYSSGKGKLYLSYNCDDFTNEGLKLYTPGISFISILDDAGSKNVSFNEYYHGMGSLGVTIWDIIGFSGLLVLIQIIIGLAVLLFVLSRRFGKPVIVFETIKRKENENIYALSNIYSKSKAFGVVLDTVFDRFKKDLAKYLGLDGVKEDNELINEAARNKFLIEMDIQGLINRCSNFIASGGGSIKELLHLVQWIEKIRRGIK